MSKGLNRGSRATDGPAHAGPLAAWSAIAIAAFAGSRASAGDSPGPDTPPRVVKFSCDHAPPWQDAPARYRLDHAHLGSAVKRSDGVLEAHDARAVMEEFSPTLSVGFPPLRIGDLAPAFGALYCVTEIVDLTPPGPENPNPGALRSKGWMTMRLAEKMGLPRGLAFQDGSIAVPLLEEGAELSPKAGKGSASAVFVSGRSHAAVRAVIAPGDPAAPRGPSARVLVIAQDFVSAHPKGTALPLRTKEATVRRGDELSIDGRPYGVRNVVPRDAKQHVIGWIELDPGTMAPSKPKPGSKDAPEHHGG